MPEYAKWILLIGVVVLVWFAGRWTKSTDKERERIKQLETEIKALEREKEASENRIFELEQGYIPLQDSLRALKTQINAGEDKIQAYEKRLSNIRVSPTITIDELQEFFTKRYNGSDSTEAISH